MSIYKYHRDNTEVMAACGTCHNNVNVNDSVCFVHIRSILRSKHLGILTHEFEFRVVLGHMFHVRIYNVMNGTILFQVVTDHQRKPNDPWDCR